MNGLDLQRVLANAGWEIPLIFVTGHGDVPTSVRAMKAGAIEFLTKPFQEREFLTAVANALQLDRARRHGKPERAALRERYDSLTPREREVMKHVIGGMLNKQIAAALNVGEKTVKFHRAHIMEKMIARSLAALVKMAVDLAVLIPTSDSAYLKSSRCSSPDSVFFVQGGDNTESFIGREYGGVSP